MTKKAKKYRTHPSYGMVQFNRVGGHAGRLFGTSIKDHHSTIQLVIRKADVEFDLSHEWYAGHEELIEVELSANQYAELLTTMNYGTGVPCTIRFLNGVGNLADPPDDETEVERVRHGFDDYVKKVSERYTEFTDVVAKALKGKSKKTREAIEMAIQLLHQAITSDMPFAAKQFQAATDKVTAAAKAEVEAFITTAITKTGLHVLKHHPEAVAMLEGRVEEDDGVE